MLLLPSLAHILKALDRGDQALGKRECLEFGPEVRTYQDYISLIHGKSFDVLFLYNFV